MKGLVFSEFIEFVEEIFSPEIADQIIEESALPSGGAYTAVATYDHDEMLTLVTTLSQKSGIPAAELVCTFGRHLFGRLAHHYPQLVSGDSDCLAFLQKVDSHIHVEVKKLYPDAELPRFEHTRESPDSLQLCYSSRRPFGDLARGLIEGCADHFGQTVEIDAEPLPCDAGANIRFAIRLRP